MCVVCCVLCVVWSVECTRPSPTFHKERQPATFPHAAIVMLQLISKLRSDWRTWTREAIGKGLGKVSCDKRKREKELKRKRERESKEEREKKE